MKCLFLISVFIALNFSVNDRIVDFFNYSFSIKKLSDRRPTTENIGTQTVALNGISFDKKNENPFASAQISMVNGPPVIHSTPDSTTEISKHYSYDIIATDPNELDVLTITVVIPDIIQAWLKVIEHNDTTTISGRAPSGSLGLYYIYIKVEDQLGEYDEQSYNLNVIKLNNKPEVVPFSKNIQEDDTIFFVKEDFNIRYSDADGEALQSIKVAALPQHGILKLNGVELGLNDVIGVDEINEFSYIPHKDYFGLDIFSWTASDGKDYALIPQHVSVFISSVNDPPEIIDFEVDPFTFEYGNETIVITSAGVVVDADGDKIEKVIVSIAKNYIQGEDSIFYETIEGLNYLWQDTVGVLTIRGIAIPSVYQDALRSLMYVNLRRLAPSGDFREVEIMLFDSDTMSIPYLRRINFENTFVELDIPNAFSPNGDEVNDTWNIENLNSYENYEIAVYSRTGLLIFKSNSYLNEWDGTYEGEFVPAGNYYYLINLNKFEKVYKGTILVLR
jgi:gliding motility-associated-like protein